MIGFFSEHCEQKRSARRFSAAAPRLDRYEDSVDLRKGLRVIETQDPPSVGLAVEIEDAEVEGTRRFALNRLFLAPGLKGAGFFHPRLPVEIEGVEQQRLSLRVEDAAEWFPCSAATVDIEDVSYIKIAGTHQVANVTVGRKELFGVFQPLLLLLADRCNFHEAVLNTMELR